jgi:glycosyltransferase involved in cell wall biosynthesis
MKIKKRVYLIGSAYGSYRARALLEYLGASPDYTYQHNEADFYISKNKNILSRIFFKVIRTISRGCGLISILVADIIYILPMSNLNKIEMIIAKLLKKKVIGEFYISMYDTFVNDRKLVKKDSKQARKFLKIDQNFIDICDEIIFLNSAERAYYLKIIGRESALKKTALIPLATNKKQKIHLPFANNECNKLVLCWWGTFIPLHGLEKIIEAAKSLKEKGVNFKLYLFGTSEEKSKPYKEQVLSLGLEEFVFIDNNKNFSDKSLDSFLIENCDIAFGNFGDSVKAKTVMTNKVVEASSMALPVISQRTAALSEYFENEKNIYFTDSNPEFIANKIIDLAADKELMKIVAHNAYKLYESEFSKEAYIDKIIPILAKEKVL